MTDNIDYALITFINSRPEGNELRDIAIRALTDRRRTIEVTAVPEEVKRKYYGKSPSKGNSLFQRRIVKRILPTISYRKMPRLK